MTVSMTLSTSRRDRIARSISANVVSAVNWFPSRAFMALNEMASSLNSSLPETGTLVLKSWSPARRVPSINFSSGTSVRRTCVKLNKAATRSERTKAGRKIISKSPRGASTSASRLATITVQPWTRNLGSRKISRWLASWISPLTAYSNRPDASGGRSLASCSSTAGGSCWEQ